MRGYYSRVAFISLKASDCAATSQGQQLFEGGIYLRAAFISLESLKTSMTAGYGTYECDVYTHVIFDVHDDAILQTAAMKNTGG